MTLLLPLRNRHFFALDLIALAILPSIALALRLDGFGALPRYAGALLLFTLVGMVVRLLIFWRAGLYNRYWRYASVDEIGLIVATVIAATAINTILFFALRFILLLTPSPLSVLSGVEGLPLALSPQLPRSIPYIDGMLTLMAVGGSRFSIRLGERWCRPGPIGPHRRTAREAGAGGLLVQ